MTTTSRPTAAARGSSAPPGQRLSSSIRLPWLVGLASLLTLAAGVGLLSARDPASSGAPRAVLDAYEALAVGSAQQVRRSLNEGADDLEQIAVALEEDVTQDRVPEDRAFTAMAATTVWHERYLALALADPATGSAAYTTPGSPALEPVGELPTDRTVVQVLDDGRVVESVPFAEGRLAVVAVYDPAFLYPNLQPRPGELYVVDDRHRAVAAPGARGLTAPLPGDQLRAAAEHAEDGAGAAARMAGPGLASVVAFAPVHGVGPAGRSGLAVVVRGDVSVTRTPLSYRLTGALAAGLLAAVTAALFRWLHVAVIRPVLQLQRSGERVAYGDLSRPVVVDRYDEVGTVARAFERLRLALIRAQVQDLDPHGEQPTSTRGES